MAPSSKPSGFQFLGIPPKGELKLELDFASPILGFQFLGIPPKGELAHIGKARYHPGCFQFLGIPPKGEPAPEADQRPLERAVSNF